MSEITNLRELQTAITAIKAKQRTEELMLKAHFETIYENLKPINLLKSTIKELVNTPDFKEDLMNTSLSIASGYLSKKWAIGETDNFAKQLLGGALQIGVTHLVSKNADGIRAKFMAVISAVLGQK